MPQPLPLSRRLATAARWPLGITLTSWRYMWRTTVLHRRELPGDRARDAPPPLPDDCHRDDLQLPEHGAGALFHRRYEARIRDGTCAPGELIEAISSDLNRVAPSEFASFEKRRGERSRMALNDEYIVRMPGPWDGPVRVAAVTPSSFRLVTLGGHLEAGHIEFRASADGPDVRFSVESWGRSASRLVDVLYSRMRMAKEIQLHMWISLIERVRDLAGGRLVEGIVVETRWLDE